MSISVIIPVKNRANLIGATLDSILKQSLLPDEIIVVDDASTDDLQKALEPYNDRITLLKNNGKGPGAARNAGFHHSKGKFIQFFDSDDIMSVNKLEVQSALLRKQMDRGLVYGPYVPARMEHGRWMQTDVIMQYLPLPNRPLNHIVTEGWCSITQACLFSRELLDETGPWREDLLTHEDKEYWYRLGKYAPYPIHENKSITIYRQHLNQITDKLTNNLDRTHNGIRSFEIILQYAEKDDVPFFSRAIVKGMIAHYKRYCNQHGFIYDTNAQDVLYLFLSKVCSKIGRIKTGTDWQPMHGVTNSADLYNDYLRLI
jgi:glycosyltransferase involved in cell wall biosynthesis